MIFLLTESVGNIKLLMAKDGQVFIIFGGFGIFDLYIWKKKEKLWQDNLVLLTCAKYSDHWMFCWAVMATDGHIFIFLVTFFCFTCSLSCKNEIFKK